MISIHPHPNQTPIVFNLLFYKEFKNFPQFPFEYLRLHQKPYIEENSGQPVF
jgi:hypothetical protein